MLKNNFSKLKDIQRKQKNGNFIKLRKIKILQIERIQKNKNIVSGDIEK